MPILYWKSKFFPPPLLYILLRCIFSLWYFRKNVTPCEIEMRIFHLTIFSLECVYFIKQTNKQTNKNPKKPWPTSLLNSLYSTAFIYFTILSNCYLLTISQATFCLSFFKNCLQVLNIVVIPMNYLNLFLKRGSVSCKRKSKILPNCIFT